MGIITNIGPIGIIRSLSYIEPSVISKISTRDFAYQTIYGIDVEESSIGATTSIAMKFDVPPMPDGTTFDAIRVWQLAAGIGITEPTNVWAAVVNGGNTQNPTIDGGAPTWVAATSILPITAAGTTEYPTATPITNKIPLSTTTSRRGVALRLQYPDGDITRYNMGTTQAMYPTGVSIPLAQGDITANPGTQFGWGESFGVMPAIFIEYCNLSTPIVLAGGFGDSHSRGYVNVTGGKGPWGYLVDEFVANDYKNICITNLAKAGQETSQISNNMRYLLETLDIPVAIRQVASVNNKNVSFDFTTEIIDTMLAEYLADESFVDGLDRYMIGVQGPGMGGLATGAYGRYISIYDSLVGKPIVRSVDGIITDVAANGAYLTNMAAPDTGHPSELGYSTWAAEIYNDLPGVLASAGITI